MPLWRELSADLATKKQLLPAEYAKATPRPIHENDPKIAIPRKPYVNLAAGNGSSHRWFFRTALCFCWDLQICATSSRALRPVKTSSRGCLLKEMLKGHPKTAFQTQHVSKPVIDKEMCGPDMEPNPNHQRRHCGLSLEKNAWCIYIYIYIYTVYCILLFQMKDQPWWQKTCWIAGKN